VENVSVFSDSLSDYDLALLIKNGNPEYMSYLISRYENHMQSIAYKYYIPGYDKKDIMQEAYIGLYRAVLTYNPDRKSTFRGFVDLCVRGSIQTALTTAKRKKHSILNDSLSLHCTIGSDEGSELISLLPDIKSQTAEEILLKKERHLDLMEFLRRSLSPLEFSVVSLYSRSFSVTEISAVTGASLKSIDNTLQRVKNKLMRYQTKAANNGGTKGWEH
jgi:RNA polymerase sporulation-specific sigma factor